MESSNALVHVSRVSTERARSSLNPDTSLHHSQTPDAGLDGRRHPSVRVALAEHGVHGGPEHLGVALLGLFRVERHVVALLPQLRETGLQLRNGRRDLPPYVRQAAICMSFSGTTVRFQLPIRTIESSNDSHTVCGSPDHVPSSKARHRLTHPQTPTELQIARRWTLAETLGSLMMLAAGDLTASIRVCTFSTLAYPRYVSPSLRFGHDRRELQRTRARVPRAVQHAPRSSSRLVHRSNYHSLRIQIVETPSVGLGQLAEFRELVRDALLGREVFRKVGEDATRERDIAQPHLDARSARERPRNRQQRVPANAKLLGGFFTSVLLGVTVSLSLSLFPRRGFRAWRAWALRRCTCRRWMPWAPRSAPSGTR